MGQNIKKKNKTTQNKTNPGFVSSVANLITTNYSILMCETKWCIIFFCFPAGIFISGYTLNEQSCMEESYHHQTRGDVSVGQNFDKSVNPNKSRPVARVVFIFQDIVMLFSGQKPCNIPNLVQKLPNISYGLLVGTKFKIITCLSLRYI